MPSVAHTPATSTAMQAFATCAAPRANTTDTEGQRIRLAATDLFRQGRQTEADLLTHAALLHYPDSEDVLVIRALICEVQQDWGHAATALEHLVGLQGQDAPAQSWCHWVRVLRCNGELAMHPAHPDLTSELTQLEALGVAGERKAA